MKSRSRIPSLFLLAFMALCLCAPAAHSAEIADSFTLPIPTVQVTYDFGNFDDSYFWGRHLGQDYRAQPGTPVVAVANGQIKYSGNLPGIGHAVHIEHTLPNGSRLVSVYYHMKRLGQGGIALSGDVRKGQIIGYVTGVAADYGTGPHLHFGIRKGAYRSGVDARTEKWFYPGYSSIFSNGVREKNEQNPLHAIIAGEWESNPKEFIESRQTRPIPGGESVTFFATGRVTRILNDRGLLDGIFSETVALGDPVVVSVAFRTDATDAVPGNATLGIYDAERVQIQIGSNAPIVKSFGANAVTKIEVASGYGSLGSLYYYVFKGYDVCDGCEEQQINLQLLGGSQFSVPSDAVPVAPPDLSGFSEPQIFFTLVDCTEYCTLIEASVEQLGEQ